MAKNQKRANAIDHMADDNGLNAYGIPLDPDAAVAAVEAGTIKPTEKPDEVTEGPIIELFNIKVKGEDDVVLYEKKNQPFTWEKTGNFPAIFASFEGKNVKVGEAALSEDQINFVAQAFPGAAQGAVIQYLLGLHNDSERDAAKGIEYQRVLTLKKPLSDEDKTKAFEAAVRNTVRSSGLPETVVRTMLRNAIEAAAKG